MHESKRKRLQLPPPQPEHRLHCGQQASGNPGKPGPCPDLRAVFCQGTSSETSPRQPLLIHPSIGEYKCTLYIPYSSLRDWFHCSDFDVIRSLNDLSIAVFHANIGVRVDGGLSSEPELARYLRYLGMPYQHLYLIALNKRQRSSPFTSLHSVIPFHSHFTAKLPVKIVPSNKYCTDARSALYGYTVPDEKMRGAVADPCGSRGSLNVPVHPELGSFAVAFSQHRTCTLLVSVGRCLALT
jgi:hypothetical protein